MAVNIAAQCAECCDCPAPTLQWDSRSASLTKSGFSECSSFVSTPPKRYRNADGSGIEARRLSSGGNGLDVLSFSGTIALAFGETPSTSTQTLSALDCSVSGGGPYTCSSPTPPCNPPGTLSALLVQSATGSNPCVSSTEIGSNLLTPNCGTVVWFVLSNEYTTAQLKTNTVAALPAYDGDWNDTAGSFANLSTDELTYSIRESLYRFLFKIPLVGSGLCYRLEWVERFIPEAGVGIDSVEVFSRGVYRPTVTATGGGGSGCLLVAIMSSTGTITGVRVLNPGSGYTSAPTITVQSAINGGTTSTGWTASLTLGRVASVAGGSAGNYRPTLTIAAPGGGGTTATATVTLDTTGGIDATTVTLAGTLYVATPALTITPMVSGSVAASLGLHLGTETPRCAEWDGITPSGYDPEDPDTYPILGDGTNPYFELAVPSTDGLATVELVRAFCDCSDCP